MLQCWVYWIIFILGNSRHIWHRYIYIYIYICIYICKISYIHSFFIFFDGTLFSVLFAKHFEIWAIFCEIDESIAIKQSMIHQVMWYLWVFIVNPFSLLCSIFFSRKLCFLWSPCLLLIAESISLDTSGKPTVGFFLKITSPSWIILSISLDELNSIDWLLKSWWWIFLK